MTQHCVLSINLILRFHSICERFSVTWILQLQPTGRPRQGSWIVIEHLVTSSDLSSYSFQSQPETRESWDSRWLLSIFPVIGRVSWNIFIWGDDEIFSGTFANSWIMSSIYYHSAPPLPITPPMRGQSQVTWWGVDQWGAVSEYGDNKWKTGAVWYEAYYYQNYNCSSWILNSRLN